MSELEVRDETRKTWLRDSSERQLFDGEVLNLIHGADGDELDTIGGIVLREFGHMPRREESVGLGEFRCRVLNADRRRIRLLHVTRPSP